MPLLQPYVGDLEQYNPNVGFTKEGTENIRKGLLEAVMFARQEKIRRATQQRDRQIIDTLSRREGIPEQDVSGEAPSGFLSQIGDLISGGRVGSGDLPVSDLERAMATSQIKQRATEQDPLAQMIKQGQLADAQLKIFQAGGPKPTLFGGDGASIPPPGAPAPAPIAPGQGQPPTVARREPQPGTGPTSIEYDPFGRVKSQKVDVLGREKFNVQQKEKRFAQEKETTLLRNQAHDILDSISEIERSLRYFGAAGDIPAFPGEYDKKNWEANIDMLKGKLVLDVMAQLKRASRTGSTGFGQLSEKELKLLQDSATQLKKGLSEKDAQRYLNRIKKASEKILGGGSPGNKTVAPLEESFGKQFGWE